MDGSEDTPYVGRAMTRLEDRAFLTGAAAYTDDLNLPDQLYGVVVRSQEAHAAIMAVQVGEAQAMPGVVAVYTAAELRAAGIEPLPSGSVATPLPPGNSAAPVAEAPQYPLAEERVRYVGEPVAFVVAESLAVAEAAAEAITVDLTPLTAVTTADAALAPDAPALWQEAPGNRSFIWDAGDVSATDAAFESATHVVDLNLEYPRETVAFMEPRAALASVDVNTGRITLRTGCQSGHALRPLLAEVLGIDDADVHVLVPEVGGGFGARNILYPEFPLVMFAARTLGRPVKWTGTRSESFLSDSQARSQSLRASLALDADGQAQGLRLLARWWHGGYLVNRSAAIITQWMSPMVCGPYRIPTYHFQLEGVFTNTAPIAAFRGIARAEATYVLERLMDGAARQTGIDRVDLRRRNLIARADMPWETPTGAVYQPTDFAGSMDAGLQALDWDGFENRANDSRARGRRRGRAVTTYLENAGGALAEFTEMSLAGDEADGRVTALVGTQDFGMGHATAFAQVMADVLGVPPDRIDVIDGDTDRIKEGYGAHGSRAMRIGGGAVHNGAQTLVQAGREIAGDLLEAAQADVEFEAGAYRVKGTDRAVGLFAVGAEAERRGAPLTIQERFEVPGASYPAGCHLCEVEVDPETGEVWLDRYAVISDPGRVINPLLAAGQLHGGIGQGVGQALMERTVYDPESGQLLSGSFMDYCLPRADDLPNVTTAFNPTPGEDNPLGVKGIGEGPTTASPPTVVNAVLDAVADLGVTHLDMPLTPETVWQAIRDAERR